MTTNTDKAMNDQEADLLQPSTYRPDITSETQPAANTTSYRDSFSTYGSSFDFISHTFQNLDLSDENENPSNQPHFIPITTADKSRLYTSWKQTVIVKPLGRKLGYHFLKNKLQLL
ncbi:hypothetical protein A4A49_16744 [Nicotiana attenuata]|uniref:Uncharacterized protein n=1 Tax=Nicotiana attenuata TaxID=49451 RepID=A0A1J6I063_NICAT|nr:hypothetical protein A4A49_16744 [Nicotiana attenuata]